MYLLKQKIVIEIQSDEKEKVQITNPQFDAQGYTYLAARIATLYEVLQWMQEARMKQNAGQIEWNEKDNDLLPNNINC